MQAPQRTFSRPPEPVRAAAPGAAHSPSGGRAQQSPYAARFEGSVVQRGTILETLIGDKRLFRTREGELVELPDDVTAEQAAKLEADAVVATQRLGKGPAPQAVPPRRPSPPIKPSPVKAKASAGRSARAGKRALQSGAALLAGLQAVGTSKVALYLAAQGSPVLQRGVSALKRLRVNEQTHDDAEQKRAQSEQAVVIPASEGQSKGNSGQVSQVEERPAPVVDRSVADRKLRESIDSNTPRSIEDVDNFKRDMKAQHMGADVLQVVQSDKNAVTATFGDVTHTPAPIPSDHKPEELPPQETAPGTPTLNLGQGAVAVPLKEHTDGSNYLRQADSKLTEEGVSQEQLDMVDSGDLAVAKKEKQGLAESIVKEPIAIQTFARAESQRVDKELSQQEKKDRESIRGRRKNQLGATAQRQKHAKSALEKKREEVADKINGIYQAAQTKVKKRLADLETQSMKAFDDGNAKATRAFEDNVKTELDAFKDDRYSGWFGWARKAKDWLLGMDDLPQVKAIFDRNRAAFVSSIDALVTSISADNKRVIQECKDELANARKTIKEYTDSLGPSLKDIGKKAADEMSSKLNDLDQLVEKKEEDLKNQLADKQKAAIKAIDEKIEKMKEAMSGALAKLGRLLLWAAKKFFTWALSKFGFSLDTINGIIDKGTAVLKAVFTKPIQFVKNLVNAAFTGFKNFGANFLKHLKDAVFEWLTGSLEGVTLPGSWDLKGIIGVALQLIGISYQNIRTHLVEVMGEPTVAGLEKTFTLVKTLITDGPMAAWEQLKEMAGEMKDAFVDAVKSFIKQKLIEQAIQFVASIFIPGAGIIKAVIGIYDTIVFFIQKAKQIIQMVGSFLSSVSDIAAGNIAAAADALENGLARGLALVIAFLAKLLRLDGITSKIRAAIQSIRGKVDGALRKVALWIAGKAKVLVGGAKAAVARAANWWKQREPFTTKSGEHHEIYFVGEPPNIVAMVASDDPKKIAVKLTEYEKQASAKGASAEEKAGKSTISRARAVLAKDPADKQLVNLMAELFNLYEGTTTKKAVINRKTGKLGGDVVGTKMTAEWLGAPITVGTPPESGVQDVLMGRLVTDPKESSDRKYIRGHLLNEHLGGRGNAENMFPITSNANSQHLHKMESTVKQWVKLGNATPVAKRRWVHYEVRVEHDPPVFKQPGKHPANYVNAAFSCEAQKVDATGAVDEHFTTRVESTYRTKETAERKVIVEGSTTRSWDD